MKTDCTNMSADIAKLQSWATVFLDIPDLRSVVTYNVTRNLLKLTRDLHKAKTEWKDETYYQFGTTVGEMFVIATQPVPTEMLNF